MADALVRIWWFYDDRIRRGLGFGHGSIEIPLPKTYITWGPEEAGEWYEAGVAKQRNQALGVGIAAYGVDNDNMVYGRACDETIPLPMRGGDNLCGLDADAIVQWWTQVTNNPNMPYRLLSKQYNCDALVVEALKQGGAEGYVKAPGVWIARGAASLKSWVADLRVRIELMNSLIRRADDLLRRAIPEPWVPGTPLWTSQRWRTESKVIVGRRTEQVAAIDVLLPKYETAVMAGNLNEQRAALFDVLANVLQHLEQKPTSDRRQAVARLGRQVRDLIFDLYSGDGRDRR